MVRTALTLGLILLATPAWAAPEIKGAFGIELGGKAPPAIGAVLREGAGDARIIEPPRPSPPFRVYSVTVAPRSRRVFLIRAWAALSSPKACDAAFEPLVQILRKKYGTIGQRTGPRPEGQLFYIAGSGQRDLLLKCDQAMLEISYADGRLEQESAAARARAAPVPDRDAL